ncbi:MAG: CvpA family protein [Gammaproteobacteria bacterium]|nr:CvpA family protein [Gammaproteobacteria bacterium]
MEAIEISFNWLDYAILAIIAISVLISIIRGFTKEALSLAGWIVAAWVALTFSEKAEPLLRDYIEIPSIRLLVAFVALFIVTLFLAAFVNYLISQVVKKTGLSGTDRMIGIFFGIARGIVIVAVLVMVGGMTPLPQDPWWGDSQLIHYFETIAQYISQYLPDDFVAKLRYS